MIANWKDATQKLPPLTDYELDRSAEVLILDRGGYMSVGYIQYDPEWAGDLEWKLAGRDNYYAGEVVWWCELPKPPPTAPGYNIVVGLKDRYGGDYGYFEASDDAGGPDDYNSGGLWFERGKLVDYDCVFALPPEVVAGLRVAGYEVDDDCLIDDAAVAEANRMVEERTR